MITILLVIVLLFDLILLVAVINVTLRLRSHEIVLDRAIETHPEWNIRRNY
jgi:hypothetical protein